MNLPAPKVLYAALLFGLGFACFGQETGADVSEFELLQNKSGGVTITAYRGNAQDLTIPSEIGGQKITVIGSRAFFGKELRSVTIPEGVTLIAFYAFADNRLESLVIPQGVVTIEYEAFSGNELTSVELPESVTSIGVRAFANNRLNAIVMPGRVNFIGKDAFTGNSFTGITIGANRNIFTSQGFELSFVNYYASTGKKAGAYAKADRVWSLSGQLN
jgi:hypothetical protein